MRLYAAIIPASIVGLALAGPVSAQTFSFTTGPATNQMAVATRPDTGAPFEIEAADDFVLTQATTLRSATFTGLVPTGASVLGVVIEIYRVFPFESDVNRTSGSPVFSTDKVPTRVNSPSDVALASRDSASGELTFSMTTLANTFTALNSVQPGGINPKPGQTTGGNGSFTGAEVEFDVNLLQQFELLPDHYFFVPQVQLSSGTFMWLSGQRPVPFPPGFNDLQSWTRDSQLDPDWLRVGTDIVGGTPAPTFNQAFSVAGTVGVPEPASMLVLGTGLAGLAIRRRRRAA